MYCERASISWDDETVQMKEFRMMSDKESLELCYPSSTEDTILQKKRWEAEEDSRLWLLKGCYQLWDGPKIEYISSNKKQVLFLDPEEISK